MGLPEGPKHPQLSARYGIPHNGPAAHNPKPLVDSAEAFAAEAIASQNPMPSDDSAEAFVAPSKDSAVALGFLIGAGTRTSLGGSTKNLVRLEAPLAWVPGVSEQAAFEPVGVIGGTVIAGLFGAAFLRKLLTICRFSLGFAFCLSIRTSCAPNSFTFSVPPEHFSTTHRSCCRGPLLLLIQCPS
jgi:hypothetical protein